MANSESDFKKELLDSLGGMGYHAHSVSEKFQSGIPDIWVSGRELRGWVELKYATMPKMGKTPIKLNLSVLQRKHLRDEQRSGGECGWILCVKDGRRWLYYAGSDYAKEQVNQEDFTVVRKYGEALKSEELLRKIRKDFVVGLPNQDTLQES